MRHSMTGFAAAKGSHGRHSWTWDIRSVNAKGLDLRLRVPDWIEGLEAALRPMMSKALVRGNVSLSLRVQADEEAVQQQLNTAQLEIVLSAMAEIESEAMTKGVSLAPANSADILSIRGVLDSTVSNEDTGPLRAELVKAFQSLLDEFIKMRASEGAALQGILVGQLDRIADLTKDAGVAATARSQESADAMARALKRVTDNATDMDPQRVAQELALIAVKSDVTEELDRLSAHVTVARELLETNGAIGRKLDFLMQEFNREANTLCSKAGSAELSRIGLELKTVIDQMREQVQNVE